MATGPPAPAPSLARADRASESPLVRAIWASESTADGVHVAIPDESWDLIVSETTDGIVAWFGGHALEATAVPFRAGTRSLGIAFRAHTRLVGRSAPLRPGEYLRLPVARGSLELAGRSFDLPTFETVEAFVDALVRAGVLETDELVLRALTGRVFASERTVQRHFRETTGITPYAFTQVRRAHRAAELLRAGERPADVAAATGYTDQPHLTRSLRRILGETPGAVQRA